MRCPATATPSSLVLVLRSCCWKWLPIICAGVYSAMLPESKRKVALESSLVKEMFHNFVSTWLQWKQAFILPLSALCKVTTMWLCKSDVEEVKKYFCLQDIEVSSCWLPICLIQVEKNHKDQSYKMFRGIIGIHQKRVSHGCETFIFNCIYLFI